MQQKNAASRNACARTSTDASNASPESTPPPSDLNDRKAAQVSAALIHASVSLLRDLQNPEEQYSPRCNTEDASVVVETADSAPSATANDAPTAPAHAWRYTAMSAAAFTLSALLGYIATEVTRKRVRGRN